MQARQLFRISAAGAVAVVPLALERAEAEPGGNVIYGFERQTGQLVRYDYDAGEHTTVGTVTDGQQVFYDIEASAYAFGTSETPAFENIFAFHWDADTNAGRMLFVPVSEPGQSVIVNDSMEGGPIHGATMVRHQPEGFEREGWHVYAVQHELIDDPFEVKGHMNINPNNSPNMRFEMVIPDDPDHGDEIGRNDLLHAEHWDDEENGILYRGEAERIRVRPKGPGSQNFLQRRQHEDAEWEDYPIRNNNTYVFNSNPEGSVEEQHMEVVLYNTHVVDGEAMGQWWIKIEEGSETYFGDDQVQAEFANRLVRVAHNNNGPDPDEVKGTVTEVVELSRGYEALASQDGEVFYATHGAHLWQIDTTAEEGEHEQDMGRLSGVPMELLGAAVANDTFYTARVHSGVDLYRLGNPDSGDAANVGSVPGFEDVGSIIFCPTALDQWGAQGMYD